MIQFHSIRWRNLLSTGQAWVTINFTRNPLTLIVGKNGHGKSLLLDALCFALFGKAFRDINKPQLVNAINKKDCVVELAFSVGKDVYVVRRGIKPNFFEIYKNKELIDQNSTTQDYEDVLKDIIGTTYKTFCQVNILGSASYTPFMELGAPDRRKVVEDLLDSQIYGKMLVLAKSQLKQNVEDQKEIKSQIEVVNHKINAQKLLIQRQQQDWQQRKDQLTEQISGYHDQIAEKDQAINQLAKQSAEIKQKIADLPFSVDKLVSTKADISFEMGKIEIRLADIKSELSGVDRDSCPLCKQNIDHDHRSNIKSRYEQQQAELEQQLDVLNGRNGKLQEMMLIYSELKDQITPISSSISQLTYQKQSDQQNCDKLEQQLVKLHDLQNKQVDLEQLEIFENQSKTAQIEYDRLVEHSVILKKCVEYLSDDGIKAHLINKYIPKINQSINEYLEKLDLFVEFNLDEQFKETMKSRHRDSFSYSSFSEGEKMRIDLAILFTWRRISQLRNSVSSNLLIMDEVLDGSLDSAGKTDFLQLIRSLSDAQNTIVISHDPVFSEMFENVITVTKNGNFTEYSTN